jgi:glycosyltransferase involved in cell wall biosynthesis
MTTPRVSVCIAAYNHHQYIHDCVMSAVAQADDVPLEILIGNDQSTDRTGEIVGALAERFPDVIRYFPYETKRGPGGNYQFLLTQTRGEYIAHLDGDDFWLPGKLGRQVAAMDANANLSASYTNALCVGEDGRPLGVFNNPQPATFGVEYVLGHGNFLNHSTMLYRADARTEICRWPSEWLDYQAHLMLASRGTLSYGNFLGAAYRMSSVTSVMSNQNERVRRLYWTALESVPRGSVSAESRLAASADFLGWVLVRSVRERSLKVLSEWWKVVSQAHDEGRVRLAAATVENVFNDGSKQLLSRLSALLGGTQMRVMYWR